MADNKVGRLGVLIVIASLIFIEVIYVYNALSRPRLIIDPKVRKKFLKGMVFRNFVNFELLSALEFLQNFMVPLIFSAERTTLNR